MATSSRPAGGPCERAYGRRPLPALLLLAGLLLGACGAAGGQDRPGPRPADRIKNEPESVWVEFVQLALDHKPLDLGQGFPDFAPPQYLVEALHNATSLASASQEPASSTSGLLASPIQANTNYHQYTRSFGHPRLVRALRDYYTKFRGFSALQDERRQIVVTVGAYEALFASIMAFVNPGDEVLLVEPAFDAYASMVALAGGTSVHVPLRLAPEARANATSGRQVSSEHFRLDVAELEGRVSNRSRLLVLNTPNNPLGKVYSRAELAELARVCTKHQLVVVADEVYEHLYYGPAQHTSIASLPGMWARTLTIGSAGKTFSATGWKLGWALGPAELVRHVQLVHQGAVYAVATPLQEAVARALEYETTRQAPGAYWRGLRADLAAKRDRMAAALARAGMAPVVPQGGYFMLADFSALARARPEYLAGVAGDGPPGAPNTHDYRFARWLSRVHGLQGIPASAFYSAAHKHMARYLVRFCFIKRQDTLAKLERVLDGLAAAAAAAAAVAVGTPAPAPTGR